MKYICQSRRKTRLKTGLTRLLAICTAFAGIQSIAQTFDSGIPTSIFSSTNYNDTMYVGFANANNDVSIESNATVSANQVIIGQLSANNVLSVVGDSRLTAGIATTNGMSTGGVVVGDGDGEAALRINHNSRLNTDYLYVGDETNHSGQVVISGNGSEINVAQDTVVGSTGSNNSINIGDGTALNVGNNLMIGSNTGSNNLITIASGGSLFVNNTNNIDVTNATGGNGIAVNANGTLQVGGAVNTGTLGALGVDMSANANLEVGGTLTLNNSKINNRQNIILNNNLSTNTASWASSAITTIGSTTSGNSLTFTNGATGLAHNIVQLGSQTSSSGNALNVGGASSSFTASTNVYLGANGGGNSIHIGNDGQMNIGGELYLGFASSSTGNAATINSNAVLVVNGDVVVGLDGNKNTFTQTGGQVGVTNNFVLGSNSSNNRYFQTGGTNTVSGEFIIGKMVNAGGKTGSANPEIEVTTGNLAQVGKDSLLTIQKDLTVGQKGGGSILSIRDGGMVDVTGNAIIGETAGDNYIYLRRDADTRMHVGGDLVIGKEGGYNRFAIYGGTATVDGNVFLGATTNQFDQNDFIHLETTNAALNVANAMYIGASNSLNTLDIVAGATATTKDLYVGTYAGTLNNAVTVTGSDSLLSVSNKLEIGSETGTGNSVIVKSGGILRVEQSGINISGTNNILKIANGGTLKTGDWAADSAANILLESGSTLHMLGALSGANMVEGGMNYVLDGTNSSWNAGTKDLYVGYHTDNNSLVITNGAMASTSNHLFIGSGSTDNAVIIAEDGSSLHIGSDLYIGSETNGPTIVYNPFPNISLPNNTVAVLDGATLNVDNDAFLYNGAVLKIGSTSQVKVAGNYTQDKFSTLGIGISSNQVQPNLVVEGTAAFANSFSTNYPLLRVYNEGIAASNIVTIVQAGNITVDGAQATSENIAANIATNLLLGFNVRVSNNTIVLDNFITHDWKEYLDGQSLNVITQIGSLSNSTAISMVNALTGMDPTTASKTMESYYGEKMSSTPAHNAINMGLQSVAEQLTRRADNTRTRMISASAGTQQTPTGAQGPHLKDQELQGWLTTFRTHADRSSNNGFDSYDGNINGLLIGADLAVANGVLFGVAGGSSSSSMDSSNGGSTDTQTTFGSCYASAGTSEWFADASFIYGISQVDATLGTAFDTRAKYDAQNVALYFGGGKEIKGKYLIYTPQASLLGNYYTQESYVETSTTALPRSVDSFNTFYLQSAIGCNVGFYTAMGDAILKPELRAFWLHELNAREEDVNYSLSGIADSYNMQLQAPDADIIKLGGGVSAKLGQYLEVRTDLDARLAGSYSDYTLLGSIRYQF